ncbi:sodium:proton antiporter [Actinosynnema pretiosum subsp. pretiosum]|uniref:Sodium:proton antiporter n=1 Tax=Actinosynnema pretiosum subsp. pretiosum TaxID=103721 RepID=A0AA45LAX8_9PSEU|nr:Na+/H+ antiporter [Actinosynnema pretiosum subsp. pretiosum]QUF05965.1 sodium:proton antiporter [Actinosynnema pretiosum subsp. pretiosum]
MNGVQILLIVGAGIAITAVARRRGVEPGLIVVVLAAAASFLPWMPKLELDSELILAIVVPPLLYSAARVAAFTGFGANLRPIVHLGVVLVVLTTFALGFVASWALPSLGGVAFVLGAVLAPPDTITTVTHGERIGLPGRVRSILIGESLVNDATALTLFSITLLAVDGGHATIAGGITQFAYKLTVGVLVGGAFAAATLAVRKRLGNTTLETTLVLLLPFTVYLAAEEVHASGIIAVVVASFTVTANMTLDPAHRYPGAHLTRIQEKSVWAVVDFLLETFVFAYIGLRLRFVLAEQEDLAAVLLASGVLLVAAIALRLVGVYALFGRWALSLRLAGRSPRERERARRREARTSGRRRRPRLGAPTAKENLLVGWTGMRGILTLAAASAVPESVPGRDAVQAVALLVTLGTLLIQAPTIGPLARALDFDVREERAATGRMRERAEALVRRHEGFDAQRQALGAAVRDGDLDEELARDLIEEIDVRQAAAEPRPRH